MIQDFSVEFWQRLSDDAEGQHREHMSRRDELDRQRAAAAIAGLLSNDPDATRAIDEELAALECQIVGFQPVRIRLAEGLEAANALERANADLDHAQVLRVQASNRAQLAANVDTALGEFARAVAEWLNSSETATHPERAAGDLRRAFHHHFLGIGYRSKPGWWRQAVLSAAEPISLPTARPLSSVTDPAIAEADALKIAALAARESALATLNALTLAPTLPPAKPRQNRRVEAVYEPFDEVSA